MSTSTKSTDSLTTVKPFAQWYDEYSDLEIRVEDAAFRLPSFRFRNDSPVFRNHILECGKSNCESTRNKAFSQIKIEGSLEGDEKVTAEDFSKLCWALYNPTYSDYTAPLTTWITILRLAVQWEFSALKTLAFKELNTVNIPLVERIVLYQKFKAQPELLEPLYVELLSRPASPNNLTLEEGTALGLEAVIEITSAREDLRLLLPAPLQKSGPLPSSMNAAILERVKAILEPKSSSQHTASGRSVAVPAPESATDPVTNGNGSLLAPVNLIKKKGLRKTVSGEVHERQGNSSL